MTPREYAQVPPALILGEGLLRRSVRCRDCGGVLRTGAVGPVSHLALGVWRHGGVTGTCSARARVPDEGTEGRELTSLLRASLGEKERM